MDEGSRTGTGLRSRQSLRQRRDVQGLDLKIFNTLSPGRPRGLSGSDRNISGNVVVPQRRLTLPSIMKYKGTASGREGLPQRSGPLVMQQGRMTHSATALKTRDALPETNNITMLDKPPVKPPPDVHVFENDTTRKRLEEEEDYEPPPPPPDLDPVEEFLVPQRELLQRYRFGSVRGLNERKDMGSMPDVSVMRGLKGEAIPRAEASLLSAQKREELRVMRERDEQIRRHAIVLKFGDFGDWCSRHQLILLVLIVNMAAAAIFYQLLEH